MNSIRVIRERRGLTQEELAKLCELPRPHISSIERGEYRPRVDTAQKIATALGVTLDDLFAAPALPAAVGQ